MCAKTESSTLSGSSPQSLPQSSEQGANCQTVSSPTSFYPPLKDQPLSIRTISMIQPCSMHNELLSVAMPGVEMVEEWSARVAYVLQVSPVSAPPHQ